MSAAEHRRAHLMRLLDECDSMQEAAGKLGVSQPFISQIKSRRRNMGAAAARRIEQRMGYPPGYMDLPPEQAASLQDSISSLSESEVVDALLSRIPDLSPDSAQKLALALLQRSAAK